MTFVVGREDSVSDREDNNRMRLVISDAETHLPTEELEVLIRQRTSLPSDSVIKIVLVWNRNDAFPVGRESFVKFVCTA